MVDKATIAQLKDLHEPQAIASWPWGWGWYGLGVAILTLLLLGSYWGYRWYQRTAFKRQALKQLKLYKTQYQQQQDFTQYNYGFYVYRGPIVGGIWTRHSEINVDSYIILVGVIQDSFKFGYSYDITASNLGNDNTLGAHEISFTMYLNCRSRSKSYETINCPQF